MAMAVAMTACGSDDPPPSCQDAITHFYAVGCKFIDTSTNPPTETPEGTALNSCSQINAVVPDNCRDLFDDWKFCLVENAGGNDANCGSCSQEADALFACH